MPIGSLRALGFYHAEKADVEFRASGENVSISDESLSILTGVKNYKINVHNCREHYVQNLYTKNGYKIKLNRDNVSIACKVMQESSG